MWYIYSTYLKKFLLFRSKYGYLYRVFLFTLYTFSNVYRSIFFYAPCTAHYFGWNVLQSWRRVGFTLFGWFLGLLVVLFFEHRCRRSNLNARCYKRCGNAGVLKTHMKTHKKNETTFLKTFLCYQKKLYPWRKSFLRSKKATQNLSVQ